LSAKKKVVDLDKINKSNREETIKKFKAKGYDLVRISYHQTDCSLCNPYQGKTFSISGKSSKYLPLDTAITGGLFHSGCRHIISLAPEERDRFIGKLQGKEGEAARQAEIDRLAKKAGWKPEEQKKGLREWLGI
jgi:hypothetical protein